MDFLERTERNWEKLEAVDQKAKAEGKLVGRYIKEPYADSYAIYRVIKENKNSVVIQACKGIGDDWQIPYWGEQARIKKSYAIQSIAYRDRLAELFSK